VVLTQLLSKTHFIHEKSREKEQTLLAISTVVSTSCR